MPDATETKVTVDGVEPSILVRYVENSNHSDSTNIIKIFPSDGGEERFLVRGGDPVLVTDKDIAAVSGSVSLEIVGDDEAFVVPADLPPSPSSTPLQGPAAKPAGSDVPFAPIDNPPGPTGQ